MSVLRVIFSSLLLTIIAKPFVFAQVYYEDTPQDVGKFSVSAFDQVPLFSDPGAQSNVITPILYTEELKHLGQEAFVKVDRSNYIFVETADGNRGWVDDRFLVRNGGVVVILQEVPIFDKPNTYSTGTGLRFGPGELLILSDWQDNWIYLTGEKKRKFGWVEGYDRLSVDALDIQIAGKMRRAMLIDDPSEKVIALQSIGRTDQFMGSPLRDVVRELVQRIQNGDYVSEGEVFISERFPVAEEEFPGSNGGSGVPNGDPRNQEGNNGNNPGTVIREITDIETGEIYTMIEETGGIQPVKAKNPSTIYYAYHKTVPVGEKVLLKLPYAVDGRQYLPLTVIAPLSPKNPNVVGLGEEVIKKVFGVAQAKDAPKVTISYPKL